MKAVVLALAAAAPAVAQDAGERAFQRCYACHSAVSGETGTPGPNLAGVIGRRAGSRPDYEYSDALTAAGGAGLVWTPEMLARFVADPVAVVPGTAMERPGLPPAELAVLLEYLKKSGATGRPEPR